MTEPTKEQMQEFIDAAFAFDAINTSSTAQSQRFSTALNRLRKEKPARMGACFLDGATSRERIIELTPEVIARLYPTAGVDWTRLKASIALTSGEQRGVEMAQKWVADATPEIDGKL